MYRWLLLGPVLIYCAISAWVGGRLIAVSPAFTDLIAANYGSAGLSQFKAGADLAWFTLAKDIAFLVAGLLLLWLAAFRPGVRYPAWVAWLKYLTGLVLSLLAIGVTAFLGNWSGMTAAVLYSQVHKPLPVLLFATWLPQFLLEVAGLSVVLAVPWYWLVRGIQVRSLRRATFESWVEARQLVVPAVWVLVAAAFLGVWAAPSLVTWALR